MKRTIIYLMTSLLLTLPSGCGKHSVPEVDAQTGQYIFFDAGVGQTKGALVEGETLPAAAGTAFGVFGFRSDGTTPVFNRYKVSPTDGYVGAVYDNVAKVYRPSADDLFTYDALSVWRTGSHSFYAYYPYEQSPAVLHVVTTGENAPYITYNQPTTLEGMVDLMTAKSGTISIDDTPSSAGVVDLEFDHRLFALNIVVKNTQQTSQASIKLKSATVQFTNVPSTAQIYFDTDNTTTIGTQTTSTESKTFDFGPDGNVIAFGSKFDINKDSSFLFLPCASLNVNITLAIINSWGESVKPLDNSASSLAPAGGFQAGKKYTLVIEKSDKGINFVYDIEDWDVKEGDDMNMGFN